MKVVNTLSSFVAHIIPVIWVNMEQLTGGFSEREAIFASAILTASWIIWTLGPRLFNRKSVPPIWLSIAYGLLSTGLIALRGSGNLAFEPWFAPLFAGLAVIGTGTAMVTAKQ